MYKRKIKVKCELNEIELGGVCVKKTCKYLGEDLEILEIFDETRNRNWDKEAQSYIDSHKDKACCLHYGEYHALYSLIREPGEESLREELGHQISLE